MQTFWSLIYSKKPYCSYLYQILLQFAVNVTGVCLKCSFLQNHRLKSCSSTRKFMVIIVWILGADFVGRHRTTLIQNVSSVMEIADCLLARKIITREMYSRIYAKETSHDRMREVYTHLDSAGRAAKAEFYQILLEKQNNLVMELESGSVQA